MAEAMRDKDLLMNRVHIRLTGSKPVSAAHRSLRLTLSGALITPSRKGGGLRTDYESVLSSTHALNTTPPRYSTADFRVRRSIRLFVRCCCSLPFRRCLRPARRCPSRRARDVYVLILHPVIHLQAAGSATRSARAPAQSFHPSTAPARRSRCKLMITFCRDLIQLGGRMKLGMLDLSALYQKITDELPRIACGIIEREARSPSRLRGASEKG